MYITTFYDGVAIYRTDKVIYARFLEPHKVISTCRVAGGIRHDLDFVLNHQACEPTGHHRAKKAMHDPQGYMRTICEPIGVDPQRCAMMGTAANMMNAAFVKEEFNELEVAAIVTAGVETNAGRVGDPASVMETEEGFLRLDNSHETNPHKGTINIMLFIGHPIKTAALVRSVITATEAKSAALQELAVNSRYSDGLATGTGTDQIVVAAPEREGFKLSWAGKHSKLGELIGKTVKTGVKEALKRQNQLTPNGQCSCKIHLERFGCDTESMKDGIASHLSAKQAILLKDNFHEINTHPLTVAQVAAIAHLKDKFSWGILPVSCWKEIMGNAAAQIACSVGGRWEKFSEYREMLGEWAERQDNQGLLELCYKAISLGFGDKWPDEE